ncbi:MAG: peptidoglycan-binding domain-containing protein [Ginsengibacter sp.]
MTGKEILNLGNKHLGEPYILGSQVPKNNKSWKGPWDCAEFLSWIIFQVSGKLYGCNNDLGNPAVADAYTGYWRNDAERIGKIITVQQATRTPGAAILRVPAVGLTGHIVISNGKGGTVEAHSHVDGVINSVVNGRRWDFGILVPWINYSLQPTINYVPPDYTIYRYTLPKMVGAKIGQIQRALKAAGFDPHGIDNIFGPDTLKAVEAFQQANHLVVDGEVGHNTAKDLGITL